MSVEALSHPETLPFLPYVPSLRLLESSQPLFVVIPFVDEHFPDIHSLRFNQL